MDLYTIWKSSLAVASFNRAILNILIDQFLQIFFRSDRQASHLWFTLIKFVFLNKTI